MPFDHHAKAPAPLRQEAVLPAQSRHPVPATSHAGKPQRMPHLHGAVAGLRLLMELLDLHEQPRVGCRPRTGRSRPPRIVAASTDAQRPTQLAQPVSPVRCAWMKRYLMATPAQRTPRLFLKCRAPRAAARSDGAGASVHRCDARGRPCREMPPHQRCRARAAIYRGGCVADPILWRRPPLAGRQLPETDGFEFELFGVLLSLRHRTPPGTYCPLFEVSTKVGLAHFPIPERPLLHMVTVNPRFFRIVRIAFTACWL